jgi:simple sugar transport system substrate-binding protein
MIRNKLFVALAGAILGLTVAQPGQAKLDDDNVDVTLIVHCCPGNVFFEPVMFGAREAAELFNVNLDIQNAEGDPQRQINIIETAIANRQDGVVPMISVEDAMIEVIAKARDAGIAVVSSNIDDPDTARQAFVGQDFVASGYIIGSRMIADHGLVEGDHCVAPVEFPDLIYAGERYEGVKKALDAAGITSEMIGTGGQVAENLNIVAEYLLANPDTDCAIGLGNVPTSVLPQAAEEAGLDDLPNGGFDVNPRIMENINAGLTTATMDQQPFWQGFLPVMFIAYNVRYNLAPGGVDTGNGVVDASNAQAATDFAGTYR